VEDAAQVGELHELRELARLGGVDLPVAFAEFRRNPRQPERAEDLLLAGRAGRDGLRIDGLMLRPRPSARWRIATLCSLEPVKWWSAK
jgi:hypothetical protein